MCSSEFFPQSVIPYYVCGHRSKWPMRFGEISRHLRVLGDGFEGKYWHEHDTPEMGRRGQWQVSLQWRHHERDSVSNHQPHDCLLIVYMIVYSDADQRKHENSESLAFMRGIHRGPVNSPHKLPVTRKMLPFDEVIMFCQLYIAKLEIF